MPGVAVLAVLPFNVHNGAEPSDFEHRIRRRETGEQSELKQREGENAEAAKVPRSRRNRLHSYAGWVHPDAAGGHSDLMQQAAFGGARCQGDNAPFDPCPLPAHNTRIPGCGDGQDGVI